MGDALFAAAALAKNRGYDPEDLLRKAGERFTQDFIATERALWKDGASMEQFAPEELLRHFTTIRQERRQNEQD